MIALYNLEPQVVNSAMMRVSSYHKNKGDQVELYNHLEHNNYEKIYAFSLFQFTSKSMVTNKMICGGTGFDLTTKLSKQIEEQDYDWSLYPNCDFSLVWFSTGCIRNCPFCVVRKKEGLIKSVIPKNLNPNGKYIKIQDNNFFANPKWKDAIEQLKEWKQPIEFAGGLDIRLMTKEMAEAINSFKMFKQIKFAWDNPKEDLLPKFKEVIQWIKPYKIACYVLIGFWSSPEEDLYRIEELRKLKIDPFVMPYNKEDRYQRDFARWVNHKAIFRKVAWKDYKKKKQLTGMSSEELKE